MKSTRGINDTTRLGYISTTKKGDSSKSGEYNNDKGKPTCHYCGKLGHTTNIYKRKNGNQIPKKNAKDKCQKCNREGH